MFADAWAPGHRPRAITTTCGHCDARRDVVAVQCRCACRPTVSEATTPGVGAPSPSCPAPSRPSHVRGLRRQRHLHIGLASAARHLRTTFTATRIAPGPRRPCRCRSTVRCVRCGQTKASTSSTRAWRRASATAHRRSGTTTEQADPSAGSRKSVSRAHSTHRSHRWRRAAGSVGRLVPMDDPNRPFCRGMRNRARGRSGAALAPCGSTFRTIRYLDGSVQGRGKELYLFRGPLQTVWVRAHSRSPPSSADSEQLCPMEQAAWARWQCAPACLATACAIVLVQPVDRSAGYPARGRFARADKPGR